MENAGETCKLCLKYVQGEELTTLDENVLGKLEFLQMDLVSINGIDFFRAWYSNFTFFSKAIVMFIRISESIRFFQQFS